MTPTQLLLLPAFVHIALVIYLLTRTGYGRVRAVRTGRLKLHDIDNNKPGHPKAVRNFANNYQNQFELPVLFYVVISFAMIAGLVDSVLIVLAWVFVALRLLHSFVQTGKNDIALRFKVFLAGLICLAGMWVWFGLRLFVIG